VTYEIEALANWQTSLELEFSEAPTDLTALAPSFGRVPSRLGTAPPPNSVLVRIRRRESPA
jgi:hypothetical protein